MKKFILIHVSGMAKEAAAKTIETAEKKTGLPVLLINSNVAHAQVIDVRQKVAKKHNRNK